MQDFQRALQAIEEPIALLGTPHMNFNMRSGQPFLLLLLLLITRF